MTGPGDLYAFRALWRHYRACRRNKRNTHNALAFEVDAERNLLGLQQELRAHTYRPGRSICFITGGPKPREVFAADFRDRVVHHLLVAQQERVFERLFIHDSFACRRDKGTLAASDRLMEFLRRVTANGRRAAWALKLDVASFFPSMHKETLYEIIARHVRDPELLWLTRTLLFHDPTTSYHFRSLDRRAQGPGRPGYPVPPRKSLFGKENERGLPIGNLTSQFWGNVYLNELDHFVKRHLRCQYYLRYVDDLVLLATDPAALVRARGTVEAFLRERLRLELRADERDPQPLARGIDFVGWKTWWNRRLPRRRTLGNLRVRLEAASGGIPEAHLAGTADLDTPQFGADPGCKIVKTKFFCVPATKTNVAARTRAHRHHRARVGEEGRRRGRAKPRQPARCGQHVYLGRPWWVSFHRMCACSAGRASSAMVEPWQRGSGRRWYVQRLETRSSSEKRSSVTP